MSNTKETLARVRGRSLLNICMTKLTKLTKFVKMVNLVMHFFYKPSEALIAGTRASASAVQRS